MEQKKLGQLITDPQDRDAVHVAIAPVTAAEPLRPGEHVGFVKPGDTELVGKSKAPIGVVDPFLRRTVAAGERCWLLLHPQTVTSLRHEWAHPAFAQQVERHVAKSLAWMQDYGERYGMSATAMIAAGRDYLHSGEHLCRGAEFEGESTDDDFWRHYEIVTGETVGGRGGNFFSCSC